MAAELDDVTYNADASGGLQVRSTAAAAQANAFVRKADIKMCYLPELEMGLCNARCEACTTTPCWLAHMLQGCYSAGLGTHALPMTNC